MDAESSSFMAGRIQGKLRATNDHKYAGKSVEERLLNPRDFNHVPFEQEEVILVDDIVHDRDNLERSRRSASLSRKKSAFLPHVERCRV